MSPFRLLQRITELCIWPVVGSDFHANRGLPITSGQSRMHFTCQRAQTLPISTLLGLESGQFRPLVDAECQGYNPPAAVPSTRTEQLAERSHFRWLAVCSCPSWSIITLARGHYHPIQRTGATTDANHQLGSALTCQQVTEHDPHTGCTRSHWHASEGARSDNDQHHNVSLASPPHHATKKRIRPVCFGCNASTNTTVRIPQVRW
jgi:hypothetical protein